MNAIGLLARALLFAALAALASLSACKLEREAPRDRPAAAAPADREDAPEFAPGQLEQHFRKHGAEMGFRTKEEYLRAAQALVRGGPGVETYQRGGDTLFFREQTGEFAVLSDRGRIRTYFRPDDGRRYWERQRR